MGMSVGYSAIRKNPLTQEEIVNITAEILIYREAFAKKELPGEAFCVFPPDPNRPECVFEGATKLPYEVGMDVLSLIITGILSCLTSVRRLLPDADWEADVEGVPLIWEEESGWRLMTDKEYASRQS